MSFKKPGTFLIILISMFFAFTSSVWAASLSLGVEDSSAASNSTATVGINISEAKNMGSTQFNVSYDPAVLSAKEVAAGELLGGALLESNISEPGLIRVAVAGAQVEGSGNLIKLVFDVKGKQGDESAIAIKDIRAWDSSPEAPEMLVKNLDDGQFKVAGLPQLYIYIIAGAAVLLIGLLALFASRAKKTAK